MDSADLQFMQRALRLARRGLNSTDPNPRVGCVIVREGRVVAEGWHRRAGDLHAEAEALALAGGDARGATLYVTLEPCCHHGKTPPCSRALIASGVRRVVAAMQDPNPAVAGKGLAELKQAGIQVECGVLEPQARWLNRGFVSRMSRGRPWVRCKLAMSLDGRTAMASGESRWITSGEARMDVQRLRARSSAIMTGIGTVLADDPSLNVRLAVSGDAVRQPLRVVLDRELRISPRARLLALPGKSLIFTGIAVPQRVEVIAGPDVEVVTVPAHESGLALDNVMRELAQREINEVQLEAGATLSGAMLQAGLIDELVFYVAPHLLGDEARGLFHLPGLGSMSQRVALKIEEIRAVGEDWRITAAVTHPASVFKNPD